MRTRMEVANSDFVKCLAACAARRVVEPITIVAERETTDQAKQRAIAYYISGFHRDEIESVLEDVGFTEEDIEEAMESLAEYAEAMSKDGPFALLEFGQLVKLNKAGTSGALIDKRKDFVKIQIDDMAVRVGEADIDFRSTAALTQAFRLRKEADENIKLIAVVDYTSEVSQDQSELTGGLEMATRELLDLAREIEQDVSKDAVEVNADVHTYVMRFINRLDTLRQHAEKHNHSKHASEMLAWVNTQPAATKSAICCRRNELRYATRAYKLLNAGGEDKAAPAQNNFKAVQEYFNSWENEIKPGIEQQLQQVDQFIARNEASEQAARTQTAVTAVLKRYK